MQLFSHFKLLVPAYVVYIFDTLCAFVLLLSGYICDILAHSKNAALLFKICDTSQRLTEEDVASFIAQYGSDLPTPELPPQEVERWYEYVAAKQSRPQSGKAHSLTQLLGISDRDIFPNVHVLLILAATLPAPTCECERSFSTLRRLNTYLRSTMSSDRLDALALINIHCDTFY